MENLAYLYHILAYEDPTEKEITFTLENLELLQWLQQPKILSQGKIAGLSLFLIFASVSLPLKANGQSFDDRGDNVAEIQRCLINLGYLETSTFGYFGPKTKKAVEDFQRAQGLVVDGVVGRNTRPILFRECGRTVRQAPQSTRQVSQNTISSTRNLKLDRRGEDVRQVQQCLARLSYSVGSADGIFGSRTEAAVKQFQRDVGLPADGEVGSRTISALNSQCGGGSPTQSTTFTNPSSFSIRTLRLGMTGKDVEIVQRCLQELGDYNNSITGYFGDTTRTAVISFQQRDNNLSVDGIVGANTRRALDRRCGGIISQGFNTGFDNFESSQQQDYVVVVPITSNNTLLDVQRYIFDAFKADSRLGEYVQAGAFKNYNAAESVSRDLRAKGFNARVVHRR